MYRPVTLVVFALFVLVSASAVAQPAITFRCIITTELPDDAELQTLHANIVCLHERIERLSDTLNHLSVAMAFLSEQLAQQETSSSSKYITIVGAPPGINPLAYNPCAAPLTPYTRSLCQQRLFHTFTNLCITGNCGDGLKPFLDSMPSPWQQYMETIGPTDSLRTTWLDDVDRYTDLFVYSDHGLAIDMPEFFQRVSPDRMFEQSFFDGP